MVQKQRALVISCTGQSAQHLHVKYRNGRGVHVARLEPTLRGVVGNQQRMIGVFSQPIRGVVLVDKACVHVKDLVGIQHTMHRTRQSRTAAVRSVLEQQGIGSILHEVIGIGQTHRTQSVKANRPIVGVVLPLFQGTVPLGGRGFTNSNVHGLTPRSKREANRKGHLLTCASVDRRQALCFSICQILIACGRHVFNALHRGVRQCLGPYQWTIVGARIF